MKCLCECPDTISIPLPNGRNETIYVKWPGIEYLHGRKATHNCAKCGAGLCERCEVEINNWLLAGDYGVFKSIEPPKALCPDCAPMEINITP